MNSVIIKLGPLTKYQTVARQLSVNALFIRNAQAENTGEQVSPRMQEFKRKLRETAQFEKLEELSEHPYQEKEPLKPFPNNTNPETGEINGPKGPEPTRYGDWERKGRVSDF